MIFLAIFYFFEQSAVSAYSAYFQLFLVNKGYSYSLIGVFMAVSQIATVLIPLLVCSTYDRTGKSKRTLIVAILTATLMMYPLALCKSKILTLIAICLSAGFFWSINPLYDGLSSRVFKGDADKYGKARSIGTIGYTAALFLLGILGIPDETNNISICLVLTAIMSLLLMATLILPSSYNFPAATDGGKSTSVFSFFDFRKYDKKFLMMMAIIALSRIPQSAIDKFLSAYMTEELNFGNKFTLLIAFAAIWDVPFALLGGKLLQKNYCKPWFMVFLSSTGLALRLTIFALFRSLPAFLCGQLLSCLCFGAVQLGATKFIADNVDSAHQALGMSFYWSIATNLPQMIGSLLGGTLIENLGYPAFFLIYAALAALASVICFMKRKELS